MPESTKLLHWLRRVSLTEAVSYIVLLVASFGKRECGSSFAAEVLVPGIGMVHGALFLMLTWLLVRAHFDHGWPVKRLLAVFGATWLPFVPFWLDARVRGWIAATAAATTPRA